VNYTLSRPESGVLTGPGEAAPLTAIYAEESEGYGEEQDIDGTTYIVSNRIVVHTDYQQTPRATYHVLVENIRTQPIGPPPFEDNESDWAGYVVSQVPRNSLVLIEQLPKVIRRLDDDGTGDLARFFTAGQEVFERVLEDSDAFFPDLCEIDRMRPAFLDSLLYDLGDPFAGLFILTTTEKRKLASLLVQIYRQKGTCEGVVNAVRLFTGVLLEGCTRALEGKWRLHGGTYPSTLVPPGGPYELGTSTILGPGTDEELWSFYLLHTTPASITADELDKIAAITDYMKPAGTQYMGVKAP